MGSIDTAEPIRRPPDTSLNLAVKFAEMRDSPPVYEKVPYGHYSGSTHGNPACFINSLGTWHTLPPLVPRTLLISFESPASQETRPKLPPSPGMSPGSLTIYRRTFLGLIEKFFRAAGVGDAISAFLIDRPLSMNSRTLLHLLRKITLVSIDEFADVCGHDVDLAANVFGFTGLQAAQPKIAVQTTGDTLKKFLVRLPCRRKN